MNENIVYFEKCGKENTLEVLQLVKQTAKQKGIKKIILASTKGGTARAALEELADSDLQLVIIPWQYGFGKEQPFPEPLVSEIQGKGHRVHFGTMLFHTEGLYGNDTPRVMASLLRIFGQGMKVCVEIVMMASDGGCVALGEKVIVMAGTNEGSDTAVVATAAPSSKMSKLQIHEIICKPI
jgi:uncharacterized protein